MLGLLATQRPHTCLSLPARLPRPRRNPKAFLEALLERYVAVLQAATPSAGLGSPLRPARSHPAPGSSPGTVATGGTVPAPAAAPGGMAAPADVDLAVLLSAAAVAVLQHHPPLAEHAVALGYVDKLVKLLAARWVVLFFKLRNWSC